MQLTVHTTGQTHLQECVQDIWEGALHKEGIPLQHQFHLAIVSCAGLHKLSNLGWQCYLQTACLVCRHMQQTVGAAIQPDMHDMVLDVQVSMPLGAARSARISAT